MADTLVLLQVYKGLLHNVRYVAIKAATHTSARQTARFLQEIAILRACRSITQVCTYPPSPVLCCKANGARLSIGMKHTTHAASSLPSHTSTHAKQVLFILLQFLVCTMIVQLPCQHPCRKFTAGFKHNMCTTQLPPSVVSEACHRVYVVGDNINIMLVFHAGFMSLICTCRPSCDSLPETASDSVM